MRFFILLIILIFLFSGCIKLKKVENKTVVETAGYISNADMNILIRNRIALFLSTKYYAERFDNLNSSNIDEIIKIFESLINYSPNVYTVEAECRFVILELLSYQFIKDKNFGKADRFIKEMNKIADDGLKIVDDIFYRVSVEIIEILYHINQNDFINADLKIAEFKKNVENFKMENDKIYLEKILSAIKSKDNLSACQASDKRIKSQLNEHVDFIKRILVKTHKMISTMIEKDFIYLDSLIEKKDYKKIISYLEKLEKNIK